MMTVDENPSVKAKFREIYERHNVYNALAFGEFMSVIMSTKNMVTRYSKGTMSCSEGVLVNNIVVLSNTVGVDTCEIFETPTIVEQQYCIVRAILHHLGLPYSGGPLSPQMRVCLALVKHELRRA
jgi:hypothetical protein